MHRRVLSGILAAALYAIPVPPSIADEARLQNNPANVTQDMAQNRPCKGYLEDRIIEVDDSDIKRALSSFTDLNDGEPLIHALATYFLDAKENTCYFVRGRTLNDNLCHKYFGNRKGTIRKERIVEGKRSFSEESALCTRIPLEDMDYVETDIIDGNMRMRGEYLKEHDDVNLTIPKKFKMDAKIEEKDDGRYSISFTQNDDCEKVRIGWHVEVFLGIKLNDNEVSKNDKKSNKRIIYSLIKHLEDKGIIALDGKKSPNRLTSLDDKISRAKN